MLKAATFVNYYGKFSYNVKVNMSKDFEMTKYMYHSNSKTKFNKIPVDSFC